MIIPRLILLTVLIKTVYRNCLSSLWCQQMQWSVRCWWCSYWLHFCSKREAKKGVFPLEAPMLWMHPPKQGDLGWEYGSTHFGLCSRAEAEKSTFPLPGLLCLECPHEWIQSKSLDDGVGSPLLSLCSRAEAQKSTFTPPLLVGNPCCGCPLHDIQSKVGDGSRKVLFSASDLEQRLRRVSVWAHHRDHFALNASTSVSKARWLDGVRRCVWGALYVAVPTKVWGASLPGSWAAQDLWTAQEERAYGRSSPNIFPILWGRWAVLWLSRPPIWTFQPCMYAKYEQIYPIEDCLLPAKHMYNIILNMFSQN